MSCHAVMGEWFEWPFDPQSYGLALGLASPKVNWSSVKSQETLDFIHGVQIKRDWALLQWGHEWFVDRVVDPLPQGRKPTF